MNVVFSTWEQITNLVLGILCTVLNALEIIIIIRNRKHMKTFDLILLSLAVADLIVGLSFTFMGIYTMTSDNNLTLTSEKPVGYFIFTMQVFAVYSSITNILGISLERVLAVRLPIKHKIWMSRKNAKWVIAAIWITGIIFTTIDVGLQLTYSESNSNNNTNKNLSPGSIYTFAVTVIVFGVIFIVTYTYIIWKVVFRRQEFDPRSCDIPCKIAKQQTLILTCILVVITYLGCTYPAVIIFLVDYSSQQSSNVTFILVLVNSTLNPFLYFLKGYLYRKINAQRKVFVKLRA